MGGCLKLLKILAAAAVCAVATGCANLSTGAHVEPVANDLMVIDHRTPSQKERHRASNFSAVVRVADDGFNPRAIEMFRMAVQNDPRIVRPTTLEIDDFYIVDFFPRRINSINNGWLGNLIMKDLVDDRTDWNFVSDVAPPRDQDSIVCIVRGKLGGVPVQVAVSEVYHASAFAVLIYKDSDFLRALKSTIQRAEAAVAAQALAARTGR